MTKQEFLDFCNEEFIKRGFKKKKNKYYRIDRSDLLCMIYLQKSMAEAYYINYYFFIGNYKDVSKLPSIDEYDIYKRFAVLSKDLDEEERFLTACIEYDLYTKEEIKPFLDDEFDSYIIPVIEKGKSELQNKLDHYLPTMFPEDIEKVFGKLGF